MLSWTRNVIHKGFNFKLNGRYQMNWLTS